jgi:hypothetical protein
MNENQIADVWMLFKEYIDKKLLEAVAERYVDLLADHGISDKIMESSTGVDETLDGAIEYYLDETAEEEDEFEEDNWGYEEDEE